MKTRVGMYVSLVTILGMILLNVSWISASVYARPVVPASKVLPGGMYGHAPAGMVPFPAHQSFQYTGSLLLPAQQACLGTEGWSWRGSGFSMCFKPGHNACPVGHPWTKQLTQNYTICLSPVSSGPAMGVY